jgi:peptide/nickel transport system ATP-binding protein
MDDLALEVRDLEIGFGRGVHLRVPALDLGIGRHCLITGPSGSGKTVLLKVLLGQAPPSWVLSGAFRVHLNGCWNSLSYRRYRLQPWLGENTAVVFQDAMHALHPYRAIEAQCPASPAAYAALRLTPEQFLSGAYRARHGDPTAADSPSGPRFARDLSGGECQRVSLLFPILHHHRRLVILDEPLTDIDRISRQDVQAAIRPLLAARDKAVILVSHQTGWLPADSMQHYALEVPEDGGTRQLIHLGTGPRAATAPPRPAHRASRADAAPVLRFALRDSYRFAGGGSFRLWALDGMELDAGEALGLIGESGSGKSSLLRAIAGLLPRRDYGRRIELAMRFDGPSLEPVMRQPRRRRYGRLQFVSQDSSGALMGAERVGAHLDWLRRHKRASAPAFGRLLDEQGRALRLWHDDAGRERFLALDHGALSMGQKRRYGLLRAFLLLDIHRPEDADRPKLLLLDEISRGLDAAALAALVEALHAFRARYNVAVLAVSHDLAFVRQLCPSLRMVYNGALLPSPIRSADLMVQPEHGAALLNPYYGYFLDAHEVPTGLGVTAEERARLPLATYGGCLVRRWIRCPAEHSAQPGCVHGELAKTPGAVGVCH